VAKTVQGAAASVHQKAGSAATVRSGCICLPESAGSEDTRILSVIMSDLQLSTAVPCDSAT
jgi:hypothetical protein